MELTKRPKSFSELKKDTGLTDGGLYKALQSLEKNGYITKTDLGYLITTKGIKIIEEKKMFTQGGITIIYEGISEEKVKEIYKILSNENNFYIHAFRESDHELDKILSLSILIPELFDNK